MKYEIQNTPQLRFSGFEGEWKEKKIGKVFKINAGGDIDNERVSFEKTEKFKYPIYANAKKDKGFYGYSDIYKIESGTITVAGRGVYIGIAHARDHQYYPIVRLLILKPLANEDIYFSENVINRLNLFVESTGVPQLTAPQFSNYKISLPTLPEQQKIASFLSAVDEKIQQLSRKKELLQQYKKGVMQQLFSGELRFKDENGKDYADWEEKKLGELAKITTGKLDANAMVHDGEYRFYTCAKDYYRIDKFAFDTEALLISGNGANVGYIHYYKGKFNAYQRTYVLDRIKEDIFYLKFYLDNFLYERIYTEKKEGNTPYIVMSTLSEMEILLPSLPEQQKIATFLSNIDAKIESTSQQINQTQSFKKGLLQQLFV